MINALQSLANNSAWKEVRDTLIAERLADLKDVTKPMKVDIKIEPAVAFVSKALAAEALEELIDDIDRFAGNVKETKVNNYD